VHQIHFRPEFHLGPHWGSLQHSPRPIAGLKGPTSKGREGREEKGRRRGKEEKGKEREVLVPLKQIPGSIPALRNILRKSAQKSMSNNI